MSSSEAEVPQAPKTGTFVVKAGLAQMLKGGIIMDVVNAEQARIAEEAGACAVMALEKVPADIRKDGGVARMADPAVRRKRENRGLGNCCKTASLRVGNVFAWKGPLFALEGVLGILVCETMLPASLPAGDRLLGYLTAREVKFFCGHKLASFKVSHCSFQKVRAIKEAVTIPVMAKCRIGHFAEAQILQSLKVDFIDESEGVTPTLF